jgi:hypothetical protein
LREEIDMDKQRCVDCAGAGEPDGYGITVGTDGTPRCFEHSRLAYLAAGNVAGRSWSPAHLPGDGWTGGYSDTEIMLGAALVAARWLRDTAEPDDAQEADERDRWERILDDIRGAYADTPAGAWLESRLDAPAPAPAGSVRAEIEQAEVVARATLPFVDGISDRMGARGLTEPEAIAEHAEAMTRPFAPVLCPRCELPIGAVDRREDVGDQLLTIATLRRQHGGGSGAPDDLQLLADTLAR